MTLIPSSPKRAQSRLSLVLLAVVTLLPASCSSGASVANQSVISRRGISTLRNSSFEEPTLKPWGVINDSHIPLKLTTTTSWDGQRSIELRGNGRTISGSVALVQELQRVPSEMAGAHYYLRVRARTDRLSRPVGVDLKLTYDNGKYHFFRGRAVAGATGLPTGVKGIPPGTWRQWLQIRVNAVAKRRIAAVTVFPVNTGPGRLSGRLWVDDVELSYSP